MTHHDRHWMRVAVLWRDTLIEETLVHSGAPVTIGAARGNSLVVPDLAGIGERHRLFVPDPGGFCLLPTHGMAGRLTLAGGAERSLDAIRELRGNAIQVGGRDWGIIDLSDDLAVFFQCVAAPERVPRRPLWGNLESSMLSALLGAVVLHLGLLVVAFLFWDAAPAFATIDLEDRVVSYFWQEPPAEIPDDEVSEEPIADDTAKRAKDDEGVFGEPEKVAETKVPKTDADLVERATDVGIHKALGDNRLGGALNSVFGDTQGFADKLSAAAAGGDAEFVMGHGTRGMGLRGTGTGGGGAGFGRIRAMSRLDTGGGGATKAVLTGKRKQEKKVNVRRGPPTLAGFCKEKDILRVVRGRQKGITWCYERELARDPELSGTLTMSWRIMLDGKVGKVLVEQSLGNKALEGCVKRAIGRWSFPAPEGGMCRVRFPFVFDGGL